MTLLRITEGNEYNDYAPHEAFISQRATFSAHGYADGVFSTLKRYIAERNVTPTEHVWPYPFDRPDRAVLRHNNSYTILKA